MPLQKPLPQQQGFNLLELLVAMALSLLVIGGVIVLLVDTQRSQLLLQQQTRLHERARLAMDIIQADLRRAGFAGCDATVINIANVVPPDSQDYLSPFPILGGADNVADYGADVIDGTDVLTLTILDVDSPWVISTQTSDANGSHFTLASGSRIDDKFDGQILAAVDSDCSQLSVFRATRNSNSSVSTHSNNCSHQLRGHFDCNDTSAANSEVSFSPDSRLYPIIQRTYAIREKDENDVIIISLLRINSSTNNESLVEGVTDLQLRFGLDTNADGAVDRLLDAEQVDQSTTLDFSQAMTVEIDVTVTSESTNPNAESLTNTLSSSVTLRNGVH